MDRYVQFAVKPGWNEMCLTGGRWNGQETELSLRARGPWGGVWLALASLSLCMMHYFGIIALALMVGGEWLATRRPLRTLWPSLLGPAALLA